MGKTIKNQKLETIQVSMQEIWMHTAPKVHKTKKNYTRKVKHNKKEY